MNTAHSDQDLGGDLGGDLRRDPHGDCRQYDLGEWGRYLRQCKVEDVLGDAMHANMMLQQHLALLETHLDTH